MSSSSNSSRSIGDNLLEVIDLLQVPSIAQELRQHLGRECEAGTGVDPYLFPKLLMEYYKPMPIAPKEFVLRVLDLAIERHCPLPNVLELSRQRDSEGNITGSFTIVGDTHGQYHDFCKILSDQLAGSPSESNQILFNGDITDRGPMSVEILMVLLVFQLCSPRCVYITRGNHEARSLNKEYGFEKEVLVKYDKEVFERFEDLFQHLPLAAVFENKVFIVHGGIGPASKSATLSVLNSLTRQVHEETNDSQSTDILPELLWADPCPLNFKPNGMLVTRRRQFGPDVTESFLSVNNFKLIIRSHECFLNGFAYAHENKVLTIFSAPKYCGFHNNIGAVCIFDSKAVVNDEQVQHRVVQFEEAHGEKSHSWSKDSVRKKFNEYTREAFGKMK